MLFGVQVTHADTFSQDFYLKSGGQWSGWYTANFTAYLNKSTYAPGEAVVMSGSASSNACTNSIDADVLGWVNGNTQWVYLSGSSFYWINFAYNIYQENFHIDRTIYSFTAPSTAGTY